MEVVYLENGVQKGISRQLFWYLFVQLSLHAEYLTISAERCYRIYFEAPFTEAQLQIYDFERSSLSALREFKDAVMEFIPDKLHPQLSNVQMK